jgi:hypothetical protein
LKASSGCGSTSCILSWQTGKPEITKQGNTHNLSAQRGKEQKRKEKKRN